MPVSTVTSPSFPLDERGNLVVQDGTLDRDAQVHFEGRHNRLVVDGTVAPAHLDIHFLGDDAQVVIGALEADTELNLDITVGAGASVEIGAGVSTGTGCTLTVAPGAQVRIGAGTHLGPHVSVEAEDPHGFTGQQDVTVGSHVWVMGETSLRGGTAIGDGAVLQMVPLVDHEVEAGQLVRGLPAIPVRPVTWDRADLATED